MADFCLLCSLKLFGQDFHELANLSTEADTLQGLYAQVICESCGITLVDHTGRCVIPDCPECHPVGQGAQNKEPSQ